MTFVDRWLTRCDVLAGVLYRHTTGILVVVVDKVVLRRDDRRLWPTDCPACEDPQSIALFHTERRRRRLTTSHTPPGERNDFDIYVVLYRKHCYVECVAACSQRGALIRVTIDETLTTTTLCSQCQSHSCSVDTMDYYIMSSFCPNNIEWLVI